MGIKKNWFMKSLYRDAEVRSLMIHKYHQRIIEWIDKEPEFEHYPTSSKYFTDDTTVKFDRQSNVMVQPQESNGNRPKADIAKEMGFECLKEKYEDGLEPYDAEDIITLEKGEKKFE